MAQTLGIFEQTPTRSRCAAVYLLYEWFVNAWLASWSCRVLCQSIHFNKYLFANSHCILYQSSICLIFFSLIWQLSLRSLCTHKMCMCFDGGNQAISMASNGCVFDRYARLGTLILGINKKYQSHFTTMEIIDIFITQYLLLNYTGKSSNMICILRKDAPLRNQCIHRLLTLQQRHLWKTYCYSIQSFYWYNPFSFERIQIEIAG